MLATALASGSGAAVSNLVSASFTPTAGAVVIVFVAQQDSGTIAAPTFSFSGSGLPTFTSIRTQQETNRTHSLWRALVGASPTAGTLTITAPDGVMDSMLYSVVEFTGLNTGGTNAADAIAQWAEHIQSSDAIETNVALAAFASSNNRPYGAMAVFSAQNPTPEAGYTELHEVLESAWGNYINTMWKPDGTDTSVTWAHGAAWSRGFAVELVAGLSAAVTGTVGDGATEAEIVAGGGTIVITLTGTTWIPSS